MDATVKYVLYEPVPKSNKLRCSKCGIRAVIQCSAGLLATSYKCFNLILLLVRFTTAMSLRVVAVAYRLPSRHYLDTVGTVNRRYFKGWRLSHSSLICNGYSPLEKQE